MTVSYRRINKADSISELTQMLHRAYRPLADAGMHFTASNQTDDTTRYRLGLGETIVAVDLDRIVGTITVQRPALENVSTWYMREDVASLHQLAVSPEYQGRGIGRALLDQGEALAASWSMREVALDTCEHADALLTTYTRRGYRRVERIKHDSVSYHSIVMSKVLQTSPQ
jgi:ribosomal protein S18 acetylase RimI-like enzyme